MSQDRRVQAREHGRFRHLRQRAQAARRQETSATHLRFVLLLGFIGLVSSIDTALAVKYAPTLHHDEKNPLALQLIAPGDVSLLVGVKMYGTLLVLYALALLHHRWRRAAMTAACVLAGFQGWLLVYLFT